MQRHATFWSTPYACIVFFLSRCRDTWSIQPLRVTLTVSICQSVVWLSCPPLQSMNETHCCSQLDTTQGRSFCCHFSLVMSYQYVEPHGSIYRSLGSGTCSWSAVHLSLLAFVCCTYCSTEALCTSALTSSCRIIVRRILTGSVTRGCLSKCLASVSPPIILCTALIYSSTPITTAQRMTVWVCAL